MRPASSPRPAAPGLTWIDAKTNLPGADLPGLRSPGRRRRLRPPDRGAHFHHLMSRLTDDVPFLEDIEKEGLTRLLARLAAFCGIEVLTFCVMGNHFHALVRVPDREEWLARFDGPCGEEALLCHLGTLYSRRAIRCLSDEIGRLRDSGRAAEAQRILEAFRRRFCDPGIWVKEVKQRFAAWLNRRRGRRGTVWMERYKDVLVEQGVALRTMGCYIDLNPVRAGMAKDPGDYRWSGYGAAMAGRRWAREAIRGLAAFGGGGECDGQRALATYRVWVLSLGVEERGEGGELLRPGIEPSEARRQLERSEALVLGDALRLRVRYFSDGLALGCRDWIERVFEANRLRFGAKRRNGARAMRAIRTELRTLRDLRIKAVG